MKKRSWLFIIVMLILSLAGLNACTSQSQSQIETPAVYNQDADEEANNPPVVALLESLPPLADYEQLNTEYAAIVQEILDRCNVERAKENLPALSWDTTLYAGASIRADELLTTFSHTRPNGEACFSILNELGFQPAGAAENIAMGQRSAAEVVDAWMKSPGHRANIMGNYSKLGVGIAPLPANSKYTGYAFVQLFIQ